MIIGKATANAVAFQKLSDILITDGLTVLTNATVTSQDGYLKNTDTAINLYVGSGGTTPSTYATLVPTDSLLIAAGTNLAQVWVKSASSTVVVNFAEGATYQNASINGVIGDITATENQVPKANADGDLIASTISDDGTTVSVDANIEATGDITAHSGITVDGDTTLAGALDVTGDTTVVNLITTGTTELGGKIMPTSDDGAGLGDTTHNFSDLCLASGAEVNFANSNVVLTHTPGILTMGTGELRITTPGTDSASVVTLAGSQTLSAKSLTNPIITAPTSASTGIMLTTTVTFTENATNTIYTGTVAIPAGAWLHSIRVTSSALWGAGAAVMKVGDTADDDGYFIGVDLKATDLLVGELLDTTSSTLWGGKEGAYLVAATGQRGPTTNNFAQYYAAGSNILGTITLTTPGSTAGRTFMEVIYSIGAVVAAVPSA